MKLLSSNDSALVEPLLVLAKVIFATLILSIPSVLCALFVLLLLFVLAKLFLLAVLFVLLIMSVATAYTYDTISQ